MKYPANLLGFNIILVSVIAFSLISKRGVSAIGCDTYYRVTGEIAGCTDISTEKTYEIWLEKYSSICLEQQLLEEISIYQRKLQIYYAQDDLEDTNQYKKFDDISIEKTDIQKLSATTYGENADFCDR